MEAELWWRLVAKGDQRYQKVPSAKRSQGGDFSPIRYPIPVPKDPDPRAAAFGRPDKGVPGNGGAAWRKAGGRASAYQGAAWF